MAHGRADIETFHVPVLTVIYKNGTQKITDTQVRFIRPDVAAVDVRVNVTGGKTPDGKDVPLLKFLLNWTVTKEPNGQWLIKVMHNTGCLIRERLQFIPNEKLPEINLASSSWKL